MSAERADDLAYQWHHAWDTIALLEKATKEALDADPVYQKAKTDAAEAEGKLLQLLETTGAKNIGTKYGTVHTTTRYSASVQDPSEFKAFVIENRAWDALDLKCNSTFARSFNEEHKILPPGVQLSAKRTLSITAPK